MEANNTPQARLATNNGTTHTHQPSPSGLAEVLGISREQLAQVLTVIKNLFKRSGWDLDVMPPDDSKWRDSEKLFWLFLSAMEASNSWQYDARSRDIDKLLMQTLARLGGRLAQPPPGARERLELSEAAEAQVDGQLMALAQRKDLTPPERVRLLALLGEHDQSRRQRALSFFARSTKTLQKSKKKRR